MLYLRTFFFFYDFTVRDVKPQSLICDRFNGFVATTRPGKVPVTVRFRVHIIYLYITHSTYKPGRYLQTYDIYILYNIICKKKTSSEYYVSRYNAFH